MNVGIHQKCILLYHINKNIVTTLIQIPISYF